MNKNIYITGLLELAFLSLSCLQNRTNSNVEKKKEQVNNIDSLNAGALFSRSVLGKNMGIKSISSSELNGQNYIQLFRPEGVLDIIAYYDKPKNQLNKPTKF